MSLLYIGSHHRQERFNPDPAKFNIDIRHPYTGVSKIELINYSFPNSVPNIRKGINDTLVIDFPNAETPWVDNISIDEGTVISVPITLVEGFYGVNDITSALQLKIQEEMTNLGRTENIAFEFDSLTNKMRLTEGNNYVFRINGRDTRFNFDESMIGLPYNFKNNEGLSTWHYTFQFGNTINLAVKNIFMTILANGSTGYDVLSVDGKMYASFVIPLDIVWSAICFGKSSNAITFKYPMNIRDLQIEFRDNLGRPIHMNCFWEIVLSLS